MFDALPTALPLVATGKLKALAVVGDTPAAALPNVPALPGLLPANAKTGWNGIVVPAATPKVSVGKLNADIVAALRSPDVEERLTTLSVDVVTSSPAAFDAFIRDEIARWSDVVKRAGIRLE
jgi:tripartite-type tricarboxylate transporter receptor subunit TctC